MSGIIYSIFMCSVLVGALVLGLWLSVAAGAILIHMFSAFIVGVIKIVDFCAGGRR